MIINVSHHSIFLFIEHPPVVFSQHESGTRTSDLYNLWSRLTALCSYLNLEQCLQSDVNSLYRPQYGFTFLQKSNSVDISLVKLEKKTMSLKTKCRWKWNVVENETSLKTKRRWKRNVVENETSLKTKRRWKRNVVENETSLKTKRRWKRNVVRNKTSLGTKRRWKQNVVTLTFSTHSAWVCKERTYSLRPIFDILFK